MENQMQRKFLLLLIGAILFFVSCLLFADKKSIMLPPGTTVKKVAEKHFKFTLPRGEMIEVRNFDPAINILTGSFKILTGEAAESGVQGDCKIYDSEGKLVESGKKLIIQGNLPPAQGVTRSTAKDFMKVDDVLVFLPAMVYYMSGEMKSDPKSTPLSHTEEKK